jgi:hypothetical protein
VIDAEMIPCRACGAAPGEPCHGFSLQPLMPCDRRQDDLATLLRLLDVESAAGRHRTETT